MITKQFLSSCNEKIVKDAYKLYLNVYQSWGQSSPFNFDEFKNSYTRQSDFGPTFAFFKDSCFIGYGCIMGNYPQHKRLEIGYAVVENQRKKGLGTLICAELIKFSINKFQCKTIIADVYSGNEASVKVLVKNGFKKAGEIPNYNYSIDSPRAVMFYYLDV